MRIIYIIAALLLIQACTQSTQKPSKDTQNQPTVKPEPVKPEPVKPEPVKPEPVKPEPVKPEPVKPEPVKPEPVKPEPVKPEPVKPEPVKPEPVKPEPVKPEPVKPEPVKPEPVKPEPVAQTFQAKGQITFDLSAVNDDEIDKESAVVYFKPDKDLGQTIPTKNHLIVTENKRFKPSVLAITKGSTVTFPNRDRILHNVFSVSEGSEFDLGLYSAGQEKTTAFNQAGIKFVHCNVHHSMQADIIVLDTPWFTQVDENGNYELNDLPMESGSLYVWHPRAALQKSAISPSESSSKNLNLRITRAKVPKHLNKFGKSYRATRD